MHITAHYLYPFDPQNYYHLLLVLHQCQIDLDEGIINHIEESNFASTEGPSLYDSERYIAAKDNRSDDEGPGVQPNHSSPRKSL
ncbi:hypothetical protein ANCCAN_17329 [Ancylostoma caninum]|uniref:Uncharacterized protein n=1 Tax=Ancylostoma caninum TaxID=29170 RepID=A0A368FX51_ANCCA|nr:hypothetical protein ANCCAN_17329 [Ancylostoma caninum]